jgi:hypothetical protein
MAADVHGYNRQSHMGMFLTCEVKFGNLALYTADRQNAHSMTLAASGNVELFGIVKRKKEPYLDILAFPISHNHRTVKICGRLTLSYICKQI